MEFDRTAGAAFVMDVQLMLDRDCQSLPICTFSAHRMQQQSTELEPAIRKGEADLEDGARAYPCLSALCLVGSVKLEYHSATVVAYSNRDGVSLASAR